MRNDTFDLWLGETSAHEAITPPRVPYEEKRRKLVLHDKPNCEEPQPAGAHNAEKAPQAI